MTESTGGLIAFIGEALDMPAHAIDTSAWDSMAHLELVMALEERYGIQLTVREMIELDGLAAIQRVLTRRGVVP